MIIQCIPSEWKKLNDHLLHNVVVGYYGDDDGVVEIAIECEDCYETLVSFEEEHAEE